MAVITLSSLLARSRTVATQMGMDANESKWIDSLAGMRALLNNCVLEIYRRKSKDIRFIRDITTRTTVAITAGAGTLPSIVMRECLDSGNFADDNPDTLISYQVYAADYYSSTKFSQLGYTFLEGDTIKYTAPAPDLDSYNGNLFITSPVLPTIGSTIDFPTEETQDDVILMLAQAIRGEQKFEVLDMAA